MSYMPRVSMQQPLKNSQKINKLQIPTSSYLKSFKKTIGNNINRTKTQISQRSMGNDQNIKPSKSRQRNSIPIQNHKNQFNQLQYVMQQNQNSMEQLLNSSINQFEKLIIHEDSGQSLQQQNHRLKNALSKMKNILKDKLESALQKQKEELSKMLQDYISLITKLLQDKEQLTIRIQDMAEQYQKKTKQMEQQFNRKFKIMEDQRDQQIGSTKNQIQEFLNIIQQYEEQAKQEQAKFSQMQQRIDQLEEQRDNFLVHSKDDGDSMHHQNEQQLSLRIEAQSTKIQTLLQLLQKSQHQNNELKSQISKLKSRQNSNHNNAELKQLKQAYERRIQQIEQQHEEEFMEYERAIRDTLIKKQECIQRLNLIIEGQRQRKPAAH